MNQELLYSVCRWLDENILDFCSTDVYRPAFPNWWVATHFWVAGPLFWVTKSGNLVIF